MPTNTPRLSRLLVALVLTLLSTSLVAQPASPPSPSPEPDAVLPNPDFQTVSAKLDLGGTSCYYTDAEGAFDSLVNLVKPFRSIDPGVGGVMRIAEAGLRKLGLDQIDDFGMSTARLQSGVSRQKTYLHLKKRGSLFALAGPEPGELASLAYVPADASALWCGQFAFSHIIPLAREVAEGALATAGRGMVDDFLADIGRKTDFDIEQALASLGDEWSVHLQTPAPSGSGSGKRSGSSDDAESGDSVRFVFRIAVTSDTLGQSLHKLLSTEGTLEEQPAIGELSVWSLRAKNADQPSGFFLASGHRWLVLTNSLDDLKRSEETARGTENIRTSPEFRKLAAGMPARLNAMTFVSSRYTDYAKNNISRAIEKAAGSDEKDDAVTRGVVKAVLKTIDETSLLSPYVSWRVNDPEGIQWVQVGGYPANPATLLAASTTGIVVAIAVPAFVRARENARGQACQANLSKIDGAKEQYALEHKLKDGDTVTMEQLKPFFKHTPECPAGGTYTVGKIGEAPTCSIGDGDGKSSTPHVLPE